MMPRDPIAEYLDQLRAGLRVPPTEAELILAEAEDHLRESEAAGIAIGMTEHEAQQAAISSFGPVRAVTRAHLTRGAIGVDMAIAAWKLISLLLLVGGLAAMAGIVVARPQRVGPPGVRPVRIYGIGHDVGSASFSLVPKHLSFNWISGTWTETGVWTHLGSGRPSAYFIVWLAQSPLAWRTAVVLAMAGAVMLVGYGLSRRRGRRRGWPHLLLAGLFPQAVLRHR
jgi:hypothetical protein